MNLRRVSAVGVLPAALTLLLLTGCTSAFEELAAPGNATTTEPALPPLPEPTVPGGVSPYQVSVLEDGVTKDEYSAAVEAHRACVVEVGALPGPIEELGGEQLGFYVDVPVTAEGLGDEALSQKVFDCASQFVSAIGPAWSKQVAPSAEEQARLLVPLVECLQAVPLDSLGSDPTREDIAKALFEATEAGGEQANRAAACAEENPDAFRS